MTIDQLAALILEQQRDRIAAQYSQWQADAEQVRVVPGPKYTKVDRGPEHNMSGFLMIDNETGEIFGIKAYGVVHKQHRYGTLATADQWYWGEYGPRKTYAAMAAADAEREAAVKRDVTEGRIRYLPPGN